MQDKIQRAREFATEAHKTQFRKYSGCPYITHPSRVAERVKTLKEATENMVIAAYLHDVIEDCDVDHYIIETKFGYDVLTLILELTNKYTKLDFPELNRKARNALEYIRIKEISREAKIIKLVDRIDNLGEFPIDEGFLRRYLSESKDLLEVLRGVHPELEKELENLIGELNGRLS